MHWLHSRAAVKRPVVSKELFNKEPQKQAAQWQYLPVTVSKQGTTRRVSA